MLSGIGRHEGARGKKLPGDFESFSRCQNDRVCPQGQALLFCILGEDSNGSGSEWSAGGAPEPRPGLPHRAGRILLPLPICQFSIKAEYKPQMFKTKNCIIILPQSGFL